MITADRIAASIDRELAGLGTPERAAKERAYLKSDLRFHGATLPQIHRVVGEAWHSHGALDHDTLVATADLLWATGVFDCRMAAEDLLERGSAMLTGADLPLLERFLREAGTWALVDGLAAGPVGDLDRRPPGIGAVIERWATDPDMWIRRSALLAHLGSLRRGEGDLARFLRLADGMLDEPEFFIRKAIGWVLRETGRKRPAEVAAWLEPRIARVAGVTIREAVKHLPEADRETLLDRYRHRGTSGS
jgi:3-methyladenine DNA glycosylase AlkD